MKRLIFFTSLCFLLVLTGCSKKQHLFDASTVEEIEGFPTDEVGYELGVSGAYAGRLGSYLVLAGGCNFPEEPVYEGGAKRFYKGIYSACTANSTNDSLSWVKVGELPEEAAYGVSIQDEQAIYFIGGSNQEHQLNYVLKIYFDNDKLNVDTLPKLPIGIDNMSGAKLGNELLITSGVVGGQLSSQQIKLNLNDLHKGWVRGHDISFLPRTQSISFVEDDVYYISSGFFTGSNNHSPEVSGETFKLVKSEWVKCPSIDSELTFSGATAVTVPKLGVFAVGGVNKSIFLKALERNYTLGKDIDDMTRDSLKLESLAYLKHPQQWYKFNSELYLFDISDQSWKPILTNINLARAGAIAVPMENGFFLLGGELKPGVRTPKVVRVILK